MYITELSMDERIEKAFEVANYMATLSNQRRLMLEEFNQQLIYYINGATFKITPELICLAKTWIDKGFDTDVAFIDANDFPVIISDLNEFLTAITDQYLKAVNDYSSKFADLKVKRRVSAIVEL